MKSLTRTIIVLVVFNLTTGSFALAEKTPEGKLSTYTISGSVGMGGVVMKGLPGEPGIAMDGTYKTTSLMASGSWVPVTAKDGTYKATVEHGWSGTVTPTKKGYSFEPPEQRYTKVIRDLTNENYIAKPITYTISDVILVRGKPLPGVLVSANNGGGSDITDAQGRYSVKVPYGWSGELTISKEGFAFDPSSISSHTDVRSNVRRGDEFVQPRRPLISRRTRTITGAYKPAVGRTGGRKVLVIPATDVKVEDLAAITQDLQVMSYILDEKFKEIREEVEGVFVDFGDFFRRDSRDTEAIYLDGYGALFLMEVNFAFTPPPKAQEQEPEETAEDVDPIWQRARQKVFSPEEPTMGGTRRIRSRKGDGAVGLKQLNTEIIKMLKHAANIRNLKQDEWVIFTVFGKSRQSSEFDVYFYRNTAPNSGTSTSRRSTRPPSRYSSSKGGSYGYSAAGGSASYGSYSRGKNSGGGGGGFSRGAAVGIGGMDMEYDGGMEYGETGSNSLTAMTVRVKKSDVDDFAKGKLDFEQFRQKVQHFVMY